MTFPIFNNFIEMLDSPSQKCIQVWHQAVSAFGEAVFNLGRNLHENLASDDAVLFQIPQNGSEHLLGNVRYLSPQILETKYFILFQSVEHQKRPFVGDARDNVAYRTIREGGVNDFFPVHRTKFSHCKNTHNISNRQLLTKSQYTHQKVSSAVF